MPQEGFLNQKRTSPASLAVVIALHGAALTALMLAKGEYIIESVGTLKTRNIPIEPPPPPNEPPPQPKEMQQKAVVDQVRTLVPTPPKPTEFVFEQQPLIQPIPTPGPSGESITPPQPVPPPPPQPKAEPVRKDAVMLASSQLQPPYPAAEQRAEVEGSVTVRVTIGPDGRVKSVELVRGQNEAFFAATQRQALRHWRFKPATLDGKPVESSKVLTVHFRMMA